MFGEKNGINITALPANEVEQMKSRIQEMKTELRDEINKANWAEKEVIMLRMNNDQMRKEVERTKEESAWMRDEFAIWMEEHGRFFSAKESKLIVKHEKRLTKLEKEYQAMCQGKVSEIVNEYEEKLKEATHW